MKQIIALILLLVTATAFGQNVIQGDAGRGTSVSRGRLGVITNNVPINTYLQLTSTGVYFNPLNVNVHTASNNTFQAGTSQIFNGSTTTSNLTIRGSVFLNRVTKTVNYTNSDSDVYIVWKGTTSAQPTNFLATGSAAGRFLIIKDGQRSALTTNIIVKPLGSDTIDGASSYHINNNGDSITIIYDGTSNWEID